MEQIKDFFTALFSQLVSMTETAGFADGFNAVMRFVLPVLAFIIVFRCAKSLLSFRKEPEIWAWLCLPDGTRLPVTHWENIIGRSKRSDLVIDVPTMSRSHAVLTRYDDGSWSISDVGSRGGVFVNGKRTGMAAITINDTLSLGGIEMYLEPITHRQEVIQASSRTKAGREITPGATLFLLTLLQALTALQLLMQVDAQYLRPVFISFAGLAAAEWILFFLTRLLRRSGFEMETMAFFLSTIGMSVVTSKAPESAFKQFAALVLGIILYMAIVWSLRDLERAKKIRYVAAAAGLGLLAIYGYAVASGSDNYRLTRILAFIDPESYATSGAYQQTQSKIAIGSGGLTGIGMFVPGAISQLNYVPADWTDFVYATIGEAFGFVGCAGVLVVYFLILMRMLYLARYTRDKFGMLIIIGVMAMLLFHVFENVAMTIGLMPITGIPLPFISYGGSNMVTNMGGVGLVLNVTRNRSLAGVVATPQRQANLRRFERRY